MNIGAMRDTVTFKWSDDDGATWSDVLTCRAYINGVNGSEFFIANAGYVGSLVVNVTCRYQPALMGINPTVCRMWDQNGQEYELLSPADDKEAKHQEVIFRARRLYRDGMGEAYVQGISGDDPSEP